MDGWAGDIAWRVLAAIACVIAAGGGFEHFAELYREKLAAHHVTLNLRYYQTGRSFMRGS